MKRKKRSPWATVIVLTETTAQALADKIVEEIFPCGIYFSDWIPCIASSILAASPDLQNASQTQT